MVEHHVANVVVAGSSPVTRSINYYMKKKYILTAFGKDRPGIVESITKVLYKKGANIEDSSMSKLSGQFVIMLLFSSKDIITDEDFNIEDININVKTIEDEEPEFTSDCAALISIYGADKIGIVYNVSKVLASKHINISDLRTHKIKDLYIMIMEVELSGTNLSSLENDLKDLSKNIGVDISVQEICKETL